MDLLRHKQNIKEEYETYKDLIKDASILKEQLTPLFNLYIEAIKKTIKDKHTSSD